MTIKVPPYVAAMAISPIKVPNLPKDAIYLILAPTPKIAAAREKELRKFLEGLSRYNNVGA